ncbi:hypothetical protein [Amycolatopsis minnesotensis]|uniref:Uncharacterized protein n=1 Tax=Amycolatopsis minnesotensis TaxID=337894 RepID=A0ABN2SRY4_9PSEU
MIPKTGATGGAVVVWSGSRSAARTVAEQSEMDGETAIPSGGAAAELCVQAGSPTAMASAQSTAAIVATALFTGEEARTRPR